jgi:hypothetical protein
MKKDEIWQQIMDLKNNDTRCRGGANDLTSDEIETILGTADYFGVSNLKQILFDLKVARFPVFDWLAMACQGRVDNPEAVKVLAYSFIKSEGNVDNFIQDLRETDYDFDKSYSDIKLESYNAL